MLKQDTPTKPTLLIVEDLSIERQRYHKFAIELGYEVTVAASFDEAMAQITSHGFSVMVTDLYLGPDSATPEGLALLKHWHEHSMPGVAIAMSSDLQMKTMEEAKRLGAMAFLKKPLISADELALAIAMGKERRSLIKHEERLRKIPHMPDELWRQCPEGVVLQPEQERLIRVIARNREIPAVIYGETGTGKEEIVKLIHKRRVAEEGAIPLVSVNCAGLNGDLAVSLLFGHRKGAFSGADRHTTGFVGEADGGILFLDEVHTLDLETQHKLLRVLNDGTYTRLGDTTLQRSRFQVIVASTADLDDEVDRGRFLLDLRTRLTGIDMHLLPLRQRLAELPLFIGLYFARREIKISGLELERLVMRARQFYWRGNIRQLYKVLDALVVTATCNDEPIVAANMPVYKTMLRPEEEASFPLQSQIASEGYPDLELLRKALHADVPLEKVMTAVERAIIRASLDRHKKIADVYRGLEIGRNTLDVKRKKHGL